MTGTITTTRRAILAGAASLPALAIPAGAMAGADPFFAAIDRHRAAFAAYLSAAQLSGDCPGNAPEYDALNEAQSAANDLDRAAAHALVAVMPTSHAGLVALIAYIGDFNAGAFALPDHPTYYSSAEYWPDVTQDSEVATFGFDVLHNVGRALQAMAVRS